MEPTVMRGLRHSLEARVYGVTVVVVVVSLAVYGWLQARTAGREHRTLVVTGVRAGLANLSESVARTLVTEDFAGMDELLVRAARVPGVLRLQVCDLDGVVLGDVRREGDRARSSTVPDPVRVAVPPRGVTGEALSEGDDDTVELWEAVRVGPDPIGYVRETYDVSPLQASLRAIRNRALLVITGAVLVGLALLVWALRRPLGAIRRLAEYARDLDVHKGEQIAIPPGTIEVRQLGEALNHASAALALSERRLVEEGEAKRTLEGRLHESQKMEALGLMAGCVAHDFNNLLTVITNGARLAAEGVNPGEVREDLRHVLHAAERGAALTRSLLTFGRRQPLTITRVDLNGVVHGVEALLRKMAGSGIELRVVLDPGPLPVSADADQLGQVLVNLVTNARDAMRGAGVVTVTTGHATAGGSAASARGGSGKAWIAVSDTGVGMDDAVQARIFEPFFTTKARGSGTGLGMAIVHGIVSQHGGTIHVDSRVGAGTTFRAVLPLVAAAAAADAATSEPGAALRPEGRARDRAATPPPIPPRPEPARRRTLLLVEDDADVAHVLRRALEGQGHAVVLAADGRQGLRALADAAGAVDVLLSDVVMPDMNGVELLEQARRAIPGLPAILMSGYTADALDARRCALPRDVPLLGKPVTPTSVSVLVEELLARAAPEDACRAGPVRPS